MEKNILSKYNAEELKNQFFVNNNIEKKEIKIYDENSSQYVTGVIYMVEGKNILVLGDKNKLGQKDVFDEIDYIKSHNYNVAKYLELKKFLTTIQNYTISSLEMVTKEEQNKFIEYFVAKESRRLELPASELLNAQKIVEKLEKTKDVKNYKDLQHLKSIALQMNFCGFLDKQYDLSKNSNNFVAKEENMEQTM